jgi:hypothetical protein
MLTYATPELSRLLRSQVQKPACLASLAALVLLLSTASARADTTTLFTTLSGSPPFNLEAAAVGVDGGVDVAWADQFIAGSTADLSDAILALGNYNQEVLGTGTNSPITVDLESDANGLPGSILATLTQQGTIPQYTSPGLVTFDYSGTPVQLTSGATYWLVALETDPNSLQAWFLSNAASGLDAVNYNGSAAGPWTAGCPPGPGCSDGLHAFQVDGTTLPSLPPVTPVPEPASVFLLGLLLTTSAAIVLRRSRSLMRLRSWRSSCFCGPK